MREGLEHKGMAFRAGTSFFSGSYININLYMYLYMYIFIYLDVHQYLLLTLLQASMGMYIFIITCPEGQYLILGT